MECRISRLDPHHAPLRRFEEVYRLAMLLAEEEGEPDPPPPPDEVRRRLRLQDERTESIVLLAEVRDELVGTATLDPVETESEGRIGLLSLFVHPGCRGRGVGRKLIGQLANEADRLNLSSLRGSTTGTAGFNFYTGLGAEVIQQVAELRLSRSEIDFIGLEETARSCEREGGEVRFYRQPTMSPSTASEATASERELDPYATSHAAGLSSIVEDTREAQSINSSDDTIGWSARLWTRKTVGAETEFMWQRSRPDQLHLGSFTIRGDGNRRMADYLICGVLLGVCKALPQLQSVIAALDSSDASLATFKDRGFRVLRSHSAWRLTIDSLVDYSRPATTTLASESGAAAGEGESVSLQVPEE